MFTALIIVQVLLALSIIGLVLLQQGKGADMGAAFGAGASGSVFGSRGSGSFLSRATAVLAALFFANSILLSSPVVRTDSSSENSVTGSILSEQHQQAEVPAIDEVVEEIVEDLPPTDVPDASQDESVVTEDITSADVPDEPASTKSDLPE